MQKILLVSGSTQKSSAVGRIIESQLPYQVYSAYNSPTIQSLVNARVFNLAVFDFETVDEDTLQIVNWLREMDCNFPILMVAKSISREIENQINMLSDIYVLTDPITEKSIVGLVRKLLVVKKVPKQIYRRFDTNQIAHIEGLSTGDVLMTSMYNLSKGGAYCEFESPTMVAVGDMYRFKVFINDTNSEYTFNAKIIWTTPKGRFSGRFGCGVKFVSAKDAYHELMSKG
jgi:response regulator RpfG family c-di-GMP phosphodiesterase